MQVNQVINIQKKHKKIEQIEGFFWFFLSTKLIIENSKWKLTFITYQEK